MSREDAKKEREGAVQLPRQRGQKSLPSHESWLEASSPQSARSEAEMEQSAARAIGAKARAAMVNFILI